MRVVWKDSAKAGKEYRYRKHFVRPCRNGWVNTVPGDNNIYATLDDAKNAVDKALGGHGIHGTGRRTGKEVHTLGILD